MVCRDRQTAFLPGLKAGVSCLYEDERCGCTKYLVPARPTLLRRLLSFPRLRRGIFMPFRRRPPPHPRLRRSSPAPSRGRGPCVAIPGGKPYPGCSRWATVPGFSPGSPRALDRGDIATGGGADGEGELVPPPLSPTLQIPYFPGIPHPARAFGAPPPPPPGGGVRAWRYLVGSRIRGDTWWAAVSGMLPAGCRAPGSGVNGGLPERPGIRFSLSVKFDGIPRAGWPIGDAVARETS